MNDWRLRGERRAAPVGGGALRAALRQTPIDDGARGRALRVARTAWSEREPVPAQRRWAPGLAVAACLLLVVVAVGSAGAPGDAVARWVSEVLGVARQVEVLQPQSGQRPAAVEVVVQLGEGLDLHAPILRHRPARRRTAPHRRPLDSGHVIEERTRPPECGAC